MEKWVLIFICLCGFATGQIIPEDRMIDWTRVGVNGGIPERTTICTTIDSSIGNSATDATSAIQTAINNCPANQVVYIPAGTYTVSGSINLKDGITLRGAGTEHTTIDCSIGSSPSEDGCVNIMGSSAWNPAPAITWSAGYSKGDTVVTLSSTSGLDVGDVMFLDIINDNSFLIWDCVSSCPSTAGSRDGNKRHMMQVVEVTGISGNQVTFDPPLYMDYSAHSGHSAFWPTDTISYAGVENINFELGSMTGPKYGIKLGNGHNLWVKGVETDSTNRAHIKTYQTTKVEVRESYIHHGQSYSSVSYGIETHYTSAMLIENNIFDTLVTGIVSNSAFSGSVVAYNYLHSTRYDTPVAWQTPSFGLHAAHAISNLFEGNMVPSLWTDNWWGSSSHTTAFRNRISGRSGTKTQNTFAIGTHAHSLYNTYMGNILGTEGYHTVYEYNTPTNCQSTVGIYSTGYWGNCQTANSDNFDPDSFDTMLRHKNYDYVSNSVKNCDDAGEPGCHGITSDTLPNSLFLSSAPSWWCQETPWPPIGPDIAGYSNDIPAKRKWDNNPCTLTGSTTGCGDGTCDTGETNANCPADCPVGPVCGDGTCDNSENCSTCPDDCGNCTEDCIHDADLPVCDGCIDTTELSDYVNEWKTGTVSINNLMEVIALWKQGC